MKFVLSTAFTPLPHLPALAVTADEHDWAMIAMPDHTVNPESLTTPYPYTEDGARRWPEFTDWADQLVMMGAFATITKRIRFTTTAFVLPLRNPFIVAKAVATASVLSANRVVLTIGVGWSKDEFELMDQDFSTRGKRCDEMVEVMRLLWTGEYVSFHGQFYSFDRVEMNPPPAGPVPIWVGGISAPALNRAARIGDGWLSDLQPKADIVASISEIRRLRRNYGRDPEAFDVMAMPSDVFDVDGYRALEDDGVTHVIMQPWMLYHPGTRDLEQQKDSIKRYADEVIARFA